MSVTIHVPLDGNTLPVSSELPAGAVVHSGYSVLTAEGMMPMSYRRVSVSHVLLASSLLVYALVLWSSAGDVALCYSSADPDMARYVRKLIAEPCAAFVQNHSRVKQVRRRVVVPLGGQAAVMVMNSSLRAWFSKMFDAGPWGQRPEAFSARCLVVCPRLRGR